MSDAKPETSPSEIDAEAAKLREDRKHLKERFDKDYDETSNDGNPDESVGGELIP